MVPNGSPVSPRASAYAHASAAAASHRAAPLVLVSGAVSGPFATARADGPFQTFEAFRCRPPVLVGLPFHAR
jgi:hypothetical protein